MIPLTISIAILDKLTYRACLETDNPLNLLLAAISAAVAHLVSLAVNPEPEQLQSSLLWTVDALLYLCGDFVTLSGVEQQHQRPS